MIKIVVAGSRSITDYEQVSSYLDKELSILDSRIDPVAIVSGGASGVDSLAKRYAIEKNLPFKEFPANGNLHGKSAGPIRNKEMADYGDRLIVFWDLESRGSLDMAKQMVKQNKETIIIPLQKTITTPI